MYIIIVLFSLIAFPAQAKNTILAPWVGNDLKGLGCVHTQGYGPFDYTKRHSISPEHLELVEGAHFKPDVENLIEGPHRSSDSPWPDLDYTLRAWPNHPRALLTMIRFQEQVNRKITKHKAPVPAECYLQRAIHFSPEDPVPYALYGYYLRKLGRLEDANKYFLKATELAPEDAKLAYSYSLLLIDMKKYDDALKYGQLAYKLGNPPVSLKNKLIKLGVWK
jgi:tetratricopeptide (TPR) repeat protein